MRPVGHPLSQTISGIVIIEYGSTLYVGLQLK